MNDSIENFLRRLRFEKNMSLNTIESYKRDLYDLANYIKSDIKNTDKNNIILYLASLHEKEYNHKSIARKISCFRSFYQDLMRLELIMDNPMEYISAPKINRSLPHIVSEQEIENIFSAFDGAETFSNVRDALIFEILYSCGLRVSELCQLKIHNIYFEEEILRIFGKGNKERLIPMGRRLKLLLKKYIPLREEYIKNYYCDFLITSKFRKGVSRMFIWKLINKYAPSDQPFHPHVLRHAFASHMLAHGADIRLIQELLGHENVSTTEIYTHIDKTALRKMMLQNHPLGSK